MVIWIWWGNTSLVISRYPVSSKNLPAGFEGFRIAQISDLHNAQFGKENKKLLQMLEQEKPELIVMTGDLIDSRRTDMEVSLEFARQAADIAPCCYVTGNHEARLPEIPGFLEALTRAGVVVLRNEAVTWERKGDTITLMGLDDPVMVTKRVDGDDRPVLEAALTALTKQEYGFTILLSHRPEWFSLYQEYGMDLVFSGHAHGGQFRLPGIGGLLAPNQGFFPQYDAGVITEGETTMVVSRGLGPSIIPIRVYNRPELVIAELCGE